MPNVLKPKRSATAAKVPNTTELASGELGVNMADRKIYINNGTSVVQVGAGLLSALGDVDMTGLATGNAISWNGTKFVPSSAGAGTVTSVAVSVPTGLSVSGSPVTTTGTIAISLTAGYSIPTTASQATWDTASSERRQWDGGSTNLVAATGRTSLGATTLGGNLFTLANVAAISFPRINADNTVSTLDAAAFRTAIGAGTSSTTGTVTSVGGTGTVSGLSLSGTVTTSGNITLGGTLAVTPSNFASQTANTILAAPNGAAGVPTFRALVAADIPTLNQNTTGTAANVTGTVAIANGGTGATTAAAARTNLGGTTAGQNLFLLPNPSAVTFLRVNADNTVSALDAATFRTAIGAGTSNTSGTVTSVGGTGTVSGLTLSGTVTGSGNLTLGGTLSLTSGNVTTALGFTPYNSTNPSGYITSSASITGSAATLTTGRTIAMTGDVSWTSASFNGSANVTGTATLANSGVTAGTYTKITVDAKGRATAGTTLAATDIPDLSLEKIPDAWVKRSVRVATTANITLSGAQTIDGVAVVAGDRVLVKNQTTASQNGIYVASATAWARSADADSISELAGACVNVDSGTANGGLRFDNDLKTTDTLGTTAVNFHRILDELDLATANTANKVVLRDGSGNFSAGTITAALSGNATTATTLQTARTIGGVSFNGSANINLPGVNTAGNQNTTGTAANVTGTVAVANGGTGATTAAAARTNLGATTVGSNLFTLANVAAIAFPRINADNTVSSLDAAAFRTAIGAGTSSTTGTVTSVGGTGTVSGLTLTGTVTSTGNLTLGGTLSVAASNFASQTANTVLAAPNGAAGVPTFRALVAADVPTLNQNTTGSAATLTTGRTIALTGDVTYTSGSFNGSANVTGTATLANSGVTAGTYTKVTVDAKGRVTVGASLASADLPTYTGTITSAQVTTALGATPVYTTTDQSIAGVKTFTQSRIQVNGGGVAMFEMHIPGVHARGWYLSSDGITRLATTNGAGTASTVQLSIDGSNNFGVNTSSPGTYASAFKTVASVVRADQSMTIGSYFQPGVDQGGFINSSNGAGTNSGVPLLFQQGPSERGRFDFAGNFLVGTTDSGYNYAGNSMRYMGSILAGLMLSCPTTSNANQVSFWNPNGQVGFINSSGSGVVYGTGSDYRLKQDIEPMVGAIEKVAQLKPVKYKWKVDGSEGQGFIAHELQAIFPDAVAGEKDAVDGNGNPRYQGVDTSYLVATLTAAIQEQQAIITELTSCVSQFEERLKQLELKAA